MQREYRRLGVVLVVFISSMVLMASAFSTTSVTRTLVLFTIAVLAVSLQDILAGTTWSKVRLGTRKAARVAVIAGVAALLAWQGNADTWGMLTVLAAFTLGALNMGIEGTLQKGGARSWNQVHNLPGAQDPPRVLFPRRTLYWIQSGWPMLGLLDYLLGLPGLIWLSGAVVVTLIMFSCAITVLRRMKHERRMAKRLPRIIREYAPEFIIYTARPDDASYQVQMWLPYLERTGRRFIIVTRSAVPSKALAAVTDAPIIMCRSTSEIDAIAISSVKAVFYVNASSGNGVMVRYSQYTHVYLGHGDSDKAPSYNPTHAMYDKIFAAGAAATRRYAEHGVTVDAGKFEIVGRPQLESVAVRQQESPVATPVVLYAPTWRGHVEETFLHSLPISEEMLKQVLARDTRVIFRPHPFSYHFPEDKATIGRIHHLLAADARLTGREHIWGERAESEMSIIDCINASDCMISDVSSVVSDYLYSNKPFAMVAVNVPVDDFAAEYPIARAAYILDNGLGNLQQVLDSILLNDPLRPARISLRADYLGSAPHETYSDTFVRAALAAIGTAPIEVFTPTGTETTSRPLVSAPTPDDEPSESIDAQVSAPEDSVLDSAGDTENLPVPPARPAWRRQLRRLTRHRGRAFGYASRFIPEAMAIATMAVVLISGFDSPLFLVLALLHTGRFYYVNRSSLSNPGKINRLLNTTVASRIILTMAMVIGSVIYGNGMMSIIGAMALTSAVAFEGQSKGIWRVSGLMSSNLPGTDSAKPLPFARGIATIYSHAAIGLSAIMFTLDIAIVSDAVILLAGISSLALTLYVLFFGLLRRRVNLRLDAELPALLENHAPEFCVYFASNAGVKYQLGMWDPYFQRMGKPYIVVARSLKMMREAARVTDAPVIYRPTLGSLESVLVPSMTTAFYVNNAVKNTHLIERRELQHIWLNHGDSEKPACYNPVHAIYDKIFSAGQAGIDRYERHGVVIPRQKFTIVGRPQIEDIVSREHAPEETTVLYAPTWKGPYADSEVYSLPLGEEIVAELLTRNCRVIFRAHPFNYRFAGARQTIERIGAMLDANSLETGLNHVWGPAAEQEMSVVDCFNAATAMISDVSAMVSDFLQSTKPFAVTAMNSTAEELETQMPATKSGYILNGDMSNLAEVIDELLLTDRLADFRMEMRRYYLGDIPQDAYADYFIDRAIRTVDRTSVLAEG